MTQTKSTPPSADRRMRSLDFRLYLQAELSRRIQATPGYSLRAFARMLGTDPSALAKVLKGERPLGPRLLTQYGRNLGLNPAEIQKFVESRERTRAATQAANAADTPEYQQLTLDTFRAISDWHHYAILELIRVDGFRPEPRWIASALKIPVNEVNFAIERMVRLKLLRIEPDGKWTDLSEVSTNITGSFYDSAQRKLQKQVLEKAIHALEHIPVSRRNQTSMTFAADSERLVEAKEMIKRFRRELARFLSRGEKRDAVYQLSVSLYPLTEIKEENSK